MKYPESVMKILRQRHELDAADTSTDDDLLAITPKMAFRHLVAWELGNPGWADSFEDWLRVVGADIVWPSE